MFYRFLIFMFRSSRLVGLPKRTWHVALEWVNW